jgi:hypothetical protein
MNYLQKNPAQIGQIIHHLILIPPYIKKLQDKVQSRPFLFGRKVSKSQYSDSYKTHCNSPALDSYKESI